jgi:hypothetical protein
LGELNVLSNNRAAIGGFDESGSVPVGWYWSSTESGEDFIAWALRFSNGHYGWYFKFNPSVLRLVR